MGVKERRARERQQRRASVLDAARTILAERGFNGTTTRRIAERCELSEATLFFYFKSKDEIFTSLLLEGIEVLRRGLEQIATEDLDRRGRIARLWRFFSQVRQDHPEYFQVFAYLAHPKATASVSEEVLDELARRSGDNFRLFASLLELDGAADRVAPDLVWAAFLGLVVLGDSRRNLGAPPHPTDRELEAALSLLLDGLAPLESP